MAFIKRILGNFFRMLPYLIAYTILLTTLGVVAGLIGKASGFLQGVLPAFLTGVPAAPKTPGKAG
jgi:hypothetical protein